ncbi:hypothetical protein LZP85_10910 [Priestia flexa]|jgi:uncharacterized lipoprotein YehR (DUF1307 family)|uniref:Aminotransferase yhxA n=2 Tax=Priestia TaxID=2800373 RepID=A0A0V8JQJ3_9BACI|nr:MULTISPECIES: hypothetical protein [Bacillaceae]AQX54511.1 hypothetical protein BC359_09470 [Priestia flexa]KSU89331.1 hypothetical protein AS180_03315 [Priestia veravalensis]KZB93369.1 hypothetical protein A2U94_00075 [Bacillus sp. VT 712]MBN8252387.1 hypothetical protein [Priestia flexa]MBN8436307.1 hypothetical protein [Priestia flexa]
MSKTKKMMAGVLTTVMVTSLVGCGSNRPPEPDDDSCRDWDWDEDTQTYYCDSSSSTTGGGHYYHNGKTYSSKKSLTSDSSYKSYKSGIGSGTKGGFGG